DARALQVVEEAVPLRGPDHVQMVDMSDAVGLDGDDDVVVREQAGVTGRETPAGFGPVLQVRQLRSEDRRLERVDPLGEADLDVLVLRRPTVIPQRPDPVEDRAVVAGDRTGVAVRAEVLARVEAEAGEMADAAAAPGVDLGAVRLGRVLD